MTDVLGLLHEFGAQATFMLIGKYAAGHEDDLVELLKGEHELGNHGMLDRPYHDASIEEFGRAVDECTERIRELQRAAGVSEGVRWFRAPHGKYTRNPPIA